MGDSKDDSKASKKTQSRRSPNYPYLGLKESLKWTHVLYEANDSHYAGLGAVAAQLGLSVKSSSLLKYIGAMSQFGLVEDKGSGESRQVKVSDSGLDLVLKGENTEEWVQLLKKAALKPKLHSELWTKYGGQLPPSDDGIRFYLLREREEGKFNRSTVDGFIEQLRKTLKYAGLDKKEGSSVADEVDTGDNGSDPDELKVDIKVGSFVQWTSQGADQFPEPRKVVGLDGDWVFVEGSQTGIPMSELAVAIPPANTQQQNSPPANPFYEPRDVTLPPKQGVRRETFVLDEGPLVVEWPESISAESYKDAKDWTELFLRRLKRSVTEPVELDE